MKYFTTIRKNLATCSYYPNQTCFFDTKRLAIIFVALLTFASFFKVLIDGADNITDYIYSAYFTTTMICAFCSFIYTSIKTPTIFALIHDDTGEIMKKRMICPESKKRYIKTHRLIEKISKMMYFVIVIMTTPGFILPKAFRCYFTYFVTDFGPDAFELSFPMWFPFDWKNPIGFFYAECFQYAVNQCVTLHINALLSLALGIFMFTLEFAKDITAEVRSLNECHKTKNPEWEIVKRFSEINTNVQELVNHFNELYQPTMAILFTGSIIAICAAMLLFQIDIRSDEISIDLILLAFLYGFWSIIMLFTACELGQRSSDAYNDIDDEIIRMDWYLLPMKVKRVLPIIMMTTQKEVEIECFGSTTCNRKTFQRVCNKSYSSFTTFRKFYQ